MEIDTRPDLERNYTVELKEFVTKTLVNLIEGVKAAQLQVGEGVIVPNVNRGFGHYAQMGYTNLQAIEFEIQVRVEKAEGKEAKIGVASIITGNMGEQKRDSDEHTSTLRFKIPVALPIARSELVVKPKEEA
jgi:hypothetical protein